MRAASRGPYRVAVVPDEFDVYTVVLLRRPDDAPDLPDDELEALQARHVAYRAQLRADGLLVAGGPLEAQTDPTMRGLSIWSCGPDEAHRRSALDPSVQAGRLVFEVFVGWVPAGTLAFPRRPDPIGRREASADG